LRFAGELSALGTAFCWATSAIFFTQAGRALGSMRVNRLRMLVAFACLCVALTFTHGAPWPVWATGYQLGWLALSGAVGFVFGDSFGFRAMVILGSSRATLLSALAPVFTMALAWPLLHERPGPLALVGMALIFSGLAVVVLERAHATHESIEGSAAVGVLCGVLSAIGQGTGYVLAKKALLTGIDPVSATVIRATTAVVLLWGWAVATGQAAPTLAAARAKPGALGMAAAGAVAGPFLGVVLSLLALHYIAAGVAASISAFYPVIAILIALRLGHDRITRRIWIGAALSVLGVVVLFLR
jgi:drug/metabolite transporter (DMT)-like permease